MPTFHGIFLTGYTNSIEFASWRLNLILIGELRGSRIPSAILVACFGVTFGVKALRVAVRLGPEPWVLAWDDWRSISNWFPSRKHLSDEIGGSVKIKKSITNIHKHHTSIFRILNIEYRHTESAHITDRAKKNRWNESIWRCLKLGSTKSLESDVVKRLMDFWGPSCRKRTPKTHSWLKLTKLGCFWVNNLQPPGTFASLAARPFFLGNCKHRLRGCMEHEDSSNELSKIFVLRFFDLQDVKIFFSFLHSAFVSNFVSTKI